jgi:glycosyltransferase involved in cell wall biosynthesis
VDTQCFHPIEQRGDYYIAVSRLIGHKRLDLVVQAFSRLALPLLVVGEGPEENRLRALASSNVMFLGWQPQERLARLLGQAKAFVHAGEEDFGIAIAEAQAAGCPVITLKRGASSEIVCDERTGLLFPEQSVPSLMEAVRRLEREGVADTPSQIRARAQRFDQDFFKQSFKAMVMEKWAEFRSKLSAASFQPSVVELTGPEAILQNKSFGCEG